MKKTLIALIIVVGVFFIIDKIRAPHTTEETSSPSEEIVIGSVTPLTGECAPYGILARNVTNMILDETNASGGINGKNIKLLWEDEKCTGKDGALAAQKLINTNNVKVMFVGSSMAVLGVAPITEKQEVILFSTLATNPDIKDSGDFVFRSTPSDSSQGRVMAEYANNIYKKVGIISEQTDYALGVANTFIEYFDGDVLQENYLSSESDFKTRITKLKNSDIEALVLIPQTPTKFEILSKQLQEQNWSLPVMANDVASGMTEVVRKYSELYTKTTLIGANFMAPQSPALDVFLEKYRAKYNEEPSYLSYFASTVDGVNILLQVLSQVEDTNDTQAIRDALYNMEDFDGLLGNISFDEYGEVDITHSLFQFDGENFIPLEK